MGCCYGNNPATVAHSCLINCVPLSALFPPQKASSWEHFILKNKQWAAVTRSKSLLFTLSSALWTFLWMFPADKSIRNSVELGMMKPYLCISANIKTVFIPFASLTWTGDKHFATPPSPLPALLNCAAQRRAAATHWGQLGCQQSSEVHSRCFCHYLLKSNLRGPFQQLVKLPLI